MEKLEILIKCPYGWLAVGKKQAKNLCMVDVALLHDNIWEVIESMHPK